MIVATFKGASPTVGRIKHVSVHYSDGDSVCRAIVGAVEAFPNDKDGVVIFVAKGGVISTARAWKTADRTDFDIAVHVETFSPPPAYPSRFNGIGIVRKDVIVVRRTDVTRRLLERWSTRNSVRPGDESRNLALTLAEMTDCRMLRLGSEWVWNETSCRPFNPHAEPIVEFKSLGQEDPKPVENKISALATSAKEAPKQSTPGPGVLWVGHLYQYTGYGKANREILFRLANSMSVRIDDSHNEPCYVQEDLKKRLDVHKSVLVGQNVPLLRMMGPDHISQGKRHRIVWTMQETSVRVHEDMVKRANENFDELWTPSSWNAEVFRDSGVKLPMRVMPLGVDPVVFRPIDKGLRPICRRISGPKAGTHGVPEGFVFLTVGLPGFRKGWDVIADAAELAFSGKKKVHFVIALTHSPPAWNEKVYKQFAKYKVPIWTLEGSFNEHQMAEIYCGANAYVSASRGEGFNLPAAEAAACGLPVIVPDNTCHKEIFGPEAFMFSPDGVKKYPEGDWISNWYKGQLFSRFGARSIKNLAVVMSDVYGNRGVGRWATALGEKITAKYTWDVAAARAAKRLLEVQ